MNKGDKPNIIIITGDNNKVTLRGNSSFDPAIVITLCVVAIAVLAISLSCPEKLADFVHLIVGIAIGN